VPTPDFASPVTTAVAAQYDRWPYPPPDRPMAEPPRSLAEAIAKLGPPAPRDMPEDASLLVAGCGSGRQPLSWALRHPRLRITAIDISAGAVERARTLAAEAGAANIRFELLDLHEAHRLGEKFDLVSSTGVLHHLADPEAGWAALVDVLRPGGVMQLMLYSRLARLPVRAAQIRIADLLTRPVDDDLLRAVRARVLEGPETCVTTSTDFFHLGGVHDMLVHVHEDPFDVPRIRRAIETLGLDFLGFRLPTRARRARYRAEHPDDPWCRDYDAWTALERRDPLLFIGTYEFWCRKPD
jgi:SAM-dependent methyltransferase